MLQVIKEIRGLKVVKVLKERKVLRGQLDSKEHKVVKVLKDLLV